ncbi:hypothetical protein [Glutamicibacter sp.]|jgi:Predicted SAM-dependent methyltransferases|uniref:hypothetical protein n=1 Tax=Glutamicibacter sp. TaxID=1931995 RepID=UPI002FDB5626
MNGQLPLIKSPIDRPFNRVWAMPSSETFSIPPIAEFISRHLTPGAKIVDPFARNCPLAHPWTNDLNPESTSRFHMDSLEFLKHVESEGVKADLVIFDPPYSPRQTKECYDGIGLKMGADGALRTSSWADEREVIDRIIKPNGKVLSFGWNSAGQGQGRSYRLLEILLVCHGAGHNDTICIAEQKL